MSYELHTYMRKRRTVLVISPNYKLTKSDGSKVELMSGLQLETRDNRAAPKILTILKQLQQ